MYFLMTNDVECTSIVLNKEDPRVADEVYKVGLPQLLDLLSKHDVESTFYFTGNFVELKPEAIDLVKARGHEIGCHGYNHNSSEGFDVLPYEKQVEYISKAKRIIEEAAGRIEAFRAPEARINEETIKILEKERFTSDSSVCPQRFDGFLSYGFRKKILWLFAPRRPYYLSTTSIIKEGNTDILEIPISALIFPFIGTAMRVAPTVTRVVRKVLFMESHRKGTPITFLFHPNECLSGEQPQHKHDDKEHLTTHHVFADNIRTKLKLRNMGKRAISLMDEILSTAKEAGFEFISVSKYRKICGGKWRKKQCLGNA